MHARFAALAALALVAISSVTALPDSHAYSTNVRGSKRAAKRAARRAAKYDAASQMPEDTDDTYTPVVDETYVPAADDASTPVVDETYVPAADDATPVVDETYVPAADDTSAPVVDETYVPAADDASTPVPAEEQPDDLETLPPVVADDSSNYDAPTVPPVPTTYAGNNRVSQIIRQVVDAYKSAHAVPARCRLVAKQQLKAGGVARYACARQLHAKPMRLYAAMMQLTAAYKVVRIRSRADGKYVKDLNQLRQRTGSWTIEWGGACALPARYADGRVCLRFFVNNNCQPGKGDAYEGTEPVQNESAPY